MVVTFLIQGPKTPEMKNKNKVFLGGLPANVTETIIRQAFEPFGQVSEFFLTYFAQQFACTYLQTRNLQILPRDIQGLTQKLATGILATFASTDS